MYVYICTSSNLFTSSSSIWRIAYASSSTNAYYIYMLCAYTQRAMCRYIYVYVCIYIHILPLPTSSSPRPRFVASRQRVVPLMCVYVHSIYMHTHIYTYMYTYNTHISCTSSNLRISSFSICRIASASRPAVPEGGGSCIYVSILYTYT